MRFDRLITLGAVRPVRRALDRLPALGLRRSPFDPRLPILMYHSISDDPEPRVRPYYKVCTSPRRFAEQMQWLADWGYRGVTLSEGLAMLARMERSAQRKKESAWSQEGGTKSREEAQKLQATNHKSAPTETFDLGPTTSGASPSTLAPC